MSTYRPDRDWSSYNARLIGRGNVSLFLHQDVLSVWKNAYQGRKRKAGGQFRYSYQAIETCLMLAQLFRLPLRQCQGFVQGFLDALNVPLTAPHYSTLCRRAGRMRVTIKAMSENVCDDDKPIVLAIDSTGLRLYNGSDWHGHRRKADGPKWQDKWRKLHIGIDTATGRILVGRLSSACDHDCAYGPDILCSIQEPVCTVAADMAYDTTPMRKAASAKNARQLIPPNRRATQSCNNRNLRPFKTILRQRDEAIAFIKKAIEQGKNPEQARALWRQHTGYHVRSLVETTMSQIKAFSDDRLSARKEATRQTQAMIKCKLVNTLIAA